jgi:Mor family transcriptional regulator
MEKSRSEIAYLISEWVFNKRDREILIDKMLDGLTYDELADKYCLSPQRLKVIVKVNKEKILAHT